MSDYESVLEAIARVAAASHPQARALALAEGFLTLGWDAASVAVAAAPRRTVTAEAGARGIGELDAPAPDALWDLAAATIPGADAVLPLRSGETVVGVAALAGNVDIAAPVTAGYARTVAAILARELEIERAASKDRHDLRAPLTVILGWCELLLETADDDERGPLETIVRQTERINSILDEQAASGGTGPRAERL